MVESFLRAGPEAGEMLATPTKSMALLLVAGGAVALLRAWPEPVRRNAMLILLSGACLLWGYQRNRAKIPWLLVGPCFVATCAITLVYAGGAEWARRYIGSAWLVSTALFPAALVWSLAASRRALVALVWFAAGLVYLGALFLLADWLALAAYAVVMILALVAVRQDPDVPFLPAGLGFAIWLTMSLAALIPAGAECSWLPSPLRSFGAGSLLVSQSGAESFFGSYTWERLWSIPRQAPHVRLAGVAPWWQEYLTAQVAGLGWLVVLLAVVLLVTLFLVLTPSRRSRDISHPLLWRVLAIVGWLVVGMPGDLWLVSPLLWLLLGGVLGLKEGVSEGELPGWQPMLSSSRTLIPALMAALFVVPLAQSIREWRAEHLANVPGQAIPAARWAPWRADIVEKCLTIQLEQPPTQRDDAAIGSLLTWLIRSGHEGVAHAAEAAIDAADGKQALSSLAAAVQASPSNLRIRRRYADTLRAFGLLEESREQYEACANLSPFDATLRIAIGAVWEVLHNEKLALSEYRKALTLDPQSEVARLKVTDLSSRAVL
ncbi:MAG: tetratricopeptide repeat protein [bacterium]